MAEADPNDRLYELVVSVKESLEKDINGVKESLKREIHNFRDEMTTRFDAQAARLDRQAV